MELAGTRSTAVRAGSSTSPPARCLPLRPLARVPLRRQRHAAAALGASPTPGVGRCHRPTRCLVLEGDGLFSVARRFDRHLDRDRRSDRPLFARRRTSAGGFSTLSGGGARTRKIGPSTKSRGSSRGNAHTPSWRRPGRSTASTRVRDPCASTRPPGSRLRHDSCGALRGGRALAGACKTRSRRESSINSSMPTARSTRCMSALNENMRNSGAFAEPSGGLEPSTPLYHEHVRRGSIHAGSGVAVRVCRYRRSPRLVVFCAVV